MALIFDVLNEEKKNKNFLNISMTCSILHSQNFYEKYYGYENVKKDG